MSFLTSSSFATFNCSDIFCNSLEVSVNFLLMMMFSLDSSKIRNTSGKLISSSFTTLAIKILADAVPICPVNKFSANFIKRASAVATFLSILYFKLKMDSARLVLSSPRKRCKTFSISET